MASLNGREVIEIDVDGIDMSDYPDFCDAYVSAATWADNSQPLNDAELEKLNDQMRDDGTLYERVLDHIF